MLGLRFGHTGRAARSRITTAAYHVAEGLESRTLYATFVVNTNLDNVPGSLREAMQMANATSGADTIVFNIAPGGSQTIVPLTPLPDLHDPVTIDATTQPGFSGTPIIELTGAAGPFSSGLTLSNGSDGSVIRGFVVNRWQRSGIAVMNGSGNNVIAGNWVGVDVTGNLPAPNVEGGITLLGAGPNNRVGGPGALDRNVASGNLNRGVYIRLSDHAVVQGNYIGTNAAGTAPVPNQNGGMFLEEEDFALIDGNVISGNIGSGIILVYSNDNVIAGNYIGTAAAGTGALPNQGLGVFVRVISVRNHVGVSGGPPNVIAYNTAGGVYLEWHDNFVQNNLIGIDAAGDAAGNLGDGITIVDGHNLIGGALPQDGNRIANNTGAGVAVIDGVGNTIRNNSIFSNGGLGIDLAADRLFPDGPTLNDPMDPDDGPNTLQNFPVITAATTSGTTTTIQGTLNSTPNTAFIIDLFANLLPDPSTFGEGQTLVATVTVTTDASGNATFSTTLGTAVPVGQWITATATDAVGGNTSEFSQGRAVVAPTPPPPPDDGKDKKDKKEKKDKSK